MSQNIEIQEAIEAGNKALDELRGVQKTLNTASTWGVIDIMGGGFLTSLAKREYILSARNQMEYANQCLDRFRRELQDVEAFDNVNIDLNPTFLAFDMFFDNFFSDLVVQSRISDAKAQVDRAIGTVERTIDMLSDVLLEEPVYIPDTRSFEPETHYATAEVYNLNRAIMRKAYPTTDAYMTSLAAALAKGNKLFEDDVLMARDIVRNELNLFSGFRTDLAPIVTMFATQANFATQFTRNILIAKKALERNLPGGVMMHVAAIIMALYAEMDDYDVLAERAGVLYKRMKAKHMFLTNDKDTATCLIMAFSYKTDDELISDMEYILPKLIEITKDNDASQSAAAILALFDTNINTRIHNTGMLYNSLKRYGYHVIPKHHLPLIAAAANSEDKDIMFDRICAIIEDLEINQIITRRISPSKLLSIALGLAIREHPDIVAFDAIFMTYPLWIKAESNNN